MASLVRLRGRSMLPTLADGDLLLVRRRPVHPGRLVLLRLPGGRPVSVKRIAFAVEDGWWVERDNPAEGADSWQLGTIADVDVLGLVVARVWPRPRRL